MLQRFWEVDTSGMDKLPVLKAEDNLVLNLTESSISYNNGCYKAAIPWKEKFINLPNNYEMAERRFATYPFSRCLSINIYILQQFLAP